MTRIARNLFRGVLFGVVALILLTTAAYFVIRSSFFAEYIRRQIVARIESATGARVTLESIGLEVSLLQITLRDLTIHGTEPLSDPPLFYTPRIVVRFGLFSAGHMVRVIYAGVTRPAVSIEFSADHRSNIPAPAHRRNTSLRSAVSSVTSLAIRDLDISNGSLRFAEQSIPLTVHAQDVLISALFDRAASQYQGTVTGNLQASGRASIAARLAIPFTAGARSLSVSGASINTSASRIAVTARVSQLASPLVEVHADAHLAIAQLRSSLGLPISPQPGVRSLDADFALSLSSSGFEVHQAFIDVGATHLEAKGYPGRDVAFDGSISLAQLGALFGDTNLPQGPVHVSGRAELSLSSYRVQGTVVAPSLVFSEEHLPPVRVDSTFELTPQAFSLPHIALHADRAELLGSLALGHGNAIRGQVVLTDMPLAEVLRFFTPKPIGYSGDLSARLRLRGFLSAPDFDSRLIIRPRRGGISLAGNLDTQYTASDKAWTLNGSSLSLPHSRIDISGRLGGAASLKVTSRNLGDFAPALTFLSNSRRVSLNGGAGAATITARGSLRDPVLSGSIDLTHFGVEGRRFDDLRARFEASSRELNISSASLTRGNSDSEFSGELGLTNWHPHADSAVRVDAVTHHGQLEDFLALAGEDHVAARGVVDGTLNISGQVDAPVGSATMQFADASLYGQAIHSASLQALLTDREIRLKQMTTQSSAGEIQVEGSFTHPPSDLKTGLIRTRIQAANLQIAQIAALQSYRPGASGTLSLDATIAGQLTEVRNSFDWLPSAIDGRFSATGLRDRATTYGNVLLTARTEGVNDLVSLKSTLAGSNTQVNGSVSLTRGHAFSADYSITGLNLRKLEPLLGSSVKPIEGILTAKGNLHGTPNNPEGDIRADLTHAKIYDESIQKAKLVASYSTTEVRVDSLELSGGAGSIDLAGSFVHPASRANQGRFVVQAKTSKIDLSKVEYLRTRHVSGNLEVNTNLAGDFRGKNQIDFDRADLSASVKDTRWNGNVLGEASLVTQSQGHAIAVSLDSRLPAGAVHAKGSIDPNGNYLSSLNVDVSHLDLAPLHVVAVSSLPDIHTVIDGSAQFKGPLLEPEQATAKVDFSKLEASPSAGVTFANQGTVALSLNQGVVTIGSAHFTGPSSDINVAGTFALQSGRTMKITAKGNADLAGLKHLLPGSAASGTVDLNATMQGTVANPQLSGRIRLSNASLQLADWPNGFYNANGDILLSGNGARIQTITGESGGGKVTLTGFMSLRNSTVTYDLHANAHQVRTRYADASVTANAALTLSGTSHAGLLSGTITISRVGYGQQSDIGSILSAATKPPAPPSASSGPLSSIRSHVRIVTASDVLFQTTLAQQLSATADLTLVGSLQSPGMVGRVNITGGTLVFFSNKYSVDRGNISFYDATRVHPMLDIDLETIAQGVDVNLTVAGPMDDLKLTYRSDPPLRFEDIIALLAAGRTPPDPTIAANQPLAPDQGAMQMGESALLGAAVANPLSSRLQRVFGISQLTIAPTFVSGTALPQARVTLQQQVAQNVTFTYSQDVSQTNAELVRIEWELTSRFSAVATRDENGVFSVDFFWKKNFH